MNLTCFFKRIAMTTSLALALLSQPLRASIAYGSINNFDTVNDTGHVCHGFEIEIEDCHSTDITYTYDYNHYGTCKITQDDSVPGHPRTFIRWASKKNPDGSWASHTAIPSGPINPTDGHQFTNPAVNFGGEHFGVGYSAPVGAIRYCWLIDDGAGNLVSGGTVQVSTPVYTYYPPFNGMPAQVQAEIDPPEPDEPDVMEFGNAVWVKEIRTTSHNTNEVKLRDLVSDNPDRPDEINWKNGEPDEVETEWQILQKDYGKEDGGVNNNVPAAPEDLPNGDEVVTRRYEFFKYTGPVDPESGEAIADVVGPDGIHGEGIVEIAGVEVDLSTLEVVGEFTGSQMAAVDVKAPVALIDHVSEGAVNAPFTARKLVVPGELPFVSTLQGVLPAGMEFDDINGILSGTPTVSGEYIFTVTASDLENPDVSKTYTLLIAEEGEVLPPTIIVDTVAFPLDSGTTMGDGAFVPGSVATVSASAQPGFRFLNWSDNGVVVSTSTSYSLTLDVNHSLVANFTVAVPQWTVTTGSSPLAGGNTNGGGLVDQGTSATVVATPNAGFVFSKWTENGVSVGTNAEYTFTVASDRMLVANFIPAPTYGVTTSSNPVAGGTTSGAAAYVSGSSATVTATSAPGYAFVKWTLSNRTVSTDSSYTFVVTANHNLVAHFIVAGIPCTIATSSSPSVGGTTAGAGVFGSGVMAQVTASPNPGYAFSRWKEGNTTVSTSPEYAFQVIGNRTLVAEFTEAFVITTTASPLAGGTADADSATYKLSEKVRASAAPSDGYVFANWTEDGVVVSLDENYVFDATGNRSLVANFVSDFGITVNACGEPSSGGSVSGDDTYAFGDDVIVSATSTAGHVFVNWTQGGVVVSEEPSFAFVADSHRALVAHFVPSATITTAQVPPQGGSVAGSGDYALGASVSLTATASPGFAFNGWMEGESSTSGGASLSFMANGPRTLVAKFIELPSLATTEGNPESHSMTISWPSANAGWVLEESTDLAKWTVSTRPVIAVGDQNTVTVSTVGACCYFRLVHP